MFKKNSPEILIVLCSFIVTLIVTLLSISSVHDGNDFAIALGITALVIGIIEIIVAFFLMIGGKKVYAKSFFIASGLLLLISGISCSTLLRS